MSMFLQRVNEHVTNSGEGPTGTERVAVVLTFFHKASHDDGAAFDFVLLAIRFVLDSYDEHDRERGFAWRKRDEFPNVPTVQAAVLGFDGPEDVVTSSELVYFVHLAVVRDADAVLGDG